MAVFDRRIRITRDSVSYELKVSFFCIKSILCDEIGPCLAPWFIDCCLVYADVRLNILVYVCPMADGSGLSNPNTGHCVLTTNVGCYLSTSC